MDHHDHRGYAKPQLALHIISPGSAMARSTVSATTQAALHSHQDNGTSFGAYWTQGPKSSGFRVHSGSA